MVRLGKVSLDKPLTSELWVQGSQSNKNLQSLFYSCHGQLWSYYLFFSTAIQKNKKQSFSYAPSLMWLSLMETDIPAILKITKWFNIFWHPRIYLHSHFLCSLITSTFNLNLLHIHFMHLGPQWSPNPIANSHNKYLLSRICGSQHQVMLTNRSLNWFWASCVMEEVMNILQGVQHHDCKVQIFQEGYQTATHLFCKLILDWLLWKLLKESHYSNTLTCCAWRLLKVDPDDTHVIYSADPWSVNLELT